MAFEHLHVLTTITNIQGYQSRYALYRTFAEHMATFPNVTLWTIEGIYPGQSYAVTEAHHPHHVQVELQHPIWMKENLINVLVSRLPDDGQPVAWLDGDLSFEDPTWVEQTLALLETHDILQLYEEWVDMDASDPPQERVRLQGIMKGMSMVDPAWTGMPGHPGGAWAITREAITRIGLPFMADFCPVGTGDVIFAAALLERISFALPVALSQGYRRAVHDYAARLKAAALTSTYLPVNIRHGWHGSRKQRGYNWRMNLLTASMFDPARDLHYHDNGVMELKRNMATLQLHKEIRRFFASRQEDSK